MNDLCIKSGISTVLPQVSIPDHSEYQISTVPPQVSVIDHSECQISAAPPKSQFLTSCLKCKIFTSLPQCQFPTPHVKCQKFAVQMLNFDTSLELFTLDTQIKYNCHIQTVGVQALAVRQFISFTVRSNFF